MPLRLEDLTPDAQLTGLIGREAVRIVSAQMMGEACDLVFRDDQGNPHHQTAQRHNFEAGWLVREPWRADMVNNHFQRLVEEGLFERI